MKPGRYSASRLVLTHPHVEPQDAHGPVFQVRDGGIPVLLVDAPKLRTDRVIAGDAVQQVVIGGLGPFVLAHTGALNLRQRLLQEELYIAFHRLRPAVLHRCPILLRKRRGERKRRCCGFSRRLSPLLRHPLDRQAFCAQSAALGREAQKGQNGNQANQGRGPPYTFCLHLAHSPIFSRLSICTAPYFDILLYH